MKLGGGCIRTSELIGIGFVGGCCRIPGDAFPRDRKTVDVEGIGFDRDAGNTRHLADHDVTPVEFEQFMGNDPLDRDYEMTGREARYRAMPGIAFHRDPWV